MIWHAVASYEVDGRALPALVLDGGAAFALTEAAERFPSPQIKSRVAGGVPALLDQWNAIAPELAALAEQVARDRNTLPALPAGARLRQPYTPARIYAAASNFIEHANEMGTVLAAKAESAPYVFMKASTSVIGPDEAIMLPPIAKQVDWEVELTAIIGTGGRNIPAERALDHVAAYTILNDVSARDMTRRTDYPFKFDWFRGKSFDTFGPLGPWLVPAALIGDPQQLKMQLTVNGETKQDDSTAAMIFSVAEQIAYLSSILTLHPGDAIATGTPNGVGMGSGTYLKSGDTVVATIERIGSLRNPVTGA